MAELSGASKTKIITFLRNHGSTLQLLPSDGVVCGKLYWSIPKLLKAQMNIHQSYHPNMQKYLHYCSDNCCHEDFVGYILHRQTSLCPKSCPGVSKSVTSVLWWLLRLLLGDQSKAKTPML
ncbi:hypothetical protein O6P43_012387 [Quillaja saponaria]|uniref:Uncharacterized protein n=1 Tax=Quillaja saponaria TaxID=32244 RepID=A0AAD7M1J8_QUISA|nr:hypothetical protein O6P43_012387 [Quillaja saponaria]